MRRPRQKGKPAALAAQGYELGMAETRRAPKGKVLEKRGDSPARAAFSRETGAPLDAKSFARGDESVPPPSDPQEPCLCGLGHLLAEWRWSLRGRQLPSCN